MKLDDKTLLQIDKIVKAISLCQSEKDITRLLLDLLSTKEIESISGRLFVLDLIKNHTPYRKIHEKTGVSLVTISRVAKSFKSGFGGYKLL